MNDINRKLKEQRLSAGVSEQRETYRLDIRPYGLWLAGSFLRVFMYYFCLFFLGFFVSAVFSMDNNSEIQEKVNQSEKVKKREYPISKEFSCDLCEEDNFFESFLELSIHQREIHGARIDIESLKRTKDMPLLVCKICKKTVEYAREAGEMNWHLENEHNFCRICDKECPQGIRLIEHKKQFHSEKIKFTPEE